MDKLIQEKFIYAIDDRVVEAGKILDMADLTEEESENPDTYDSVYEERFHCGVCTVRTVMETVWPSVDEYLDYLEGLIRGYETLCSSLHSDLKGILTSVDNGARATVLSVLAGLNTPPEPIERPAEPASGL